ncbi:MAG: hypothetical protein AAFN11_03545 [Chloroflexota bacterium]
MSLSPIFSRRRWKLYAQGQPIVVKHGRNERFVHPLMKAFIWALYLPDYPTASIEIRIGDKYKPDVVAFADAPAVFEVNPPPLFWGEAGRVGKDKIHSMVRRFPTTHFAMSKWDTGLSPYVDLVQEALDGVTREAPFDLISFPEDSKRLVDNDGNISITFDDVTWQRLE